MRFSSGNLDDVLFAGVTVAVADMLNLPFQDNAFDVVIEKGCMVSVNMLLNKYC